MNVASVRSHNDEILSWIIAYTEAEQRMMVKITEKSIIYCRLRNLDYKLVSVDDSIIFSQFWRDSGIS